MDNQVFQKIFNVIYMFFNNYSPWIIAIITSIIIVPQLLGKMAIRRFPNLKNFHCPDIIKFIFLFLVSSLYILSFSSLTSHSLIEEKIINIEYLSLNGESNVTTIATTLFTTLFTISLTLLGIVVTAYIFLDSTLQNREKYEQVIIVAMKKSTKNKLVYLSWLTGFCLLLSLMADNLALPLGDLTWLYYSVLVASLIDIIFLLLFLYEIINYEKKLVFFAKKIIEDCAKSLPRSGENIPDISPIKAIGDIEVILSQLLRNHEAEYHNLVKLNLNHQITNILAKKDIDIYIKNSNIYKSVEAIVTDYQQLISMRNCFVFLDVSNLTQKVREIVFSSSNIKGSIYELVVCIGQCIMQGERFDDINFNNINFGKANFKQSAFPGSAFINVDLSDASLIETDFRKSLLQGVNLSAANCCYAIFSDVKFLELTVSSKSIFAGAVFRRADLSASTLEGIASQKINFANASCRAANFISCTLSEINFENTIFQGAQLSEATIKNCVFKGCDFEKALLVSTEFSGMCQMDYANLTNVTAIASKWHGEDSKKIFQMKKVRMAGGNFTQAEFTYCSLVSSYDNDVSFVEAKFESCRFDNAIMTKTDLTDCTIISCSFRDANFVNSLLVHDSSKGPLIIKNSCFVGVNFTGAEIRGYTFENCQFDNAIFHHALLRDVTFRHCSFNHAQFNEALVMNVEWICSVGTGLLHSIKRIDFGTANDKFKMWGIVNYGQKLQTHRRNLHSKKHT